MLAGAVGWPAEVAAAYRKAGYWTGETFGDLLGRWAETYRERTAVVGGAQRWSYLELERRARQLAAGLRGLGIGPQDRVVVQLPNAPEFVALCFALFLLGAIPILALPAHRRSEISYLVQHGEAVAYVIPEVHARFDYRTLAAEVQAACPTLRQVVVRGAPGPFVAFDSLYAQAAPLPGPRPDDVALFQLSGGTTGLPKLIPRTHDDYAYSVRASAELCALDPDSSYLAVLPVAHNFPLSSPGLLGALHAGGKVVLTDNAAPDEVFALIERERVTITSLVPPLALMWMEAAGSPPPALASLKLLQVGGAKLAAETAERIRPTLGCPLQQVFGMAEGLVNYTRLDDPEELVIQTQGRPLSPADEIRVVDDADREVPPGQTGNLLVRGPYTIRGYYRAEEHNARAFTADGFYRTGDVVRVRASGHLVVEGRQKDLINRGGDKLSAEELENHLLAHPGIRNAAVVAMPDPFLGERTCAFLMARGEPPRARELKAFLRQRGLADFKLPDRLEYLDSFPETSVGKVSKKELRERIAEQIARESGEALKRS